MTDEKPIPVDIKLLQKSRLLEIEFSNGQKFSLSCEYLRLNSPSAEMREYKMNNDVTALNKKEVNIIGIDPVGQYGLKFIFDDGHQTGIYSFDRLYDMCINQKKYE